MDSKIIFIDFEEPSIEENEGREGGRSECVCVFRGSDVCHMANTIPRLFVPVQTLAAHPLPLLFIYISAWMGERRTLTESEREGFP